MAKIAFSNGALVLYTPFHRALVNDIKSLPSSARRWNPNGKTWEIDPKYGAQVVSMVERHLFQKLALPNVGQATGQPETRTVKVLYVGAVKDRGDGELSSFAWADNDWSIVFPESVLLEYFGGNKSRQQASTLYGVLGLTKDVAQSEIKSAYRRLAKLSHPDVNKEPDAASQFKKIAHAYEVLSDSLSRRKYDVGLSLTGKVEVNYALADAYRPPLRCGLVQITGTQRLGRLMVSRITSWKDIYDAQGRVLVTSWPKGATFFQEKWLEA